MMTRVMMFLLALTATGFLAACDGGDRYPVTGEECSPDDPVQTVDPAAANCVPAA